MVIQTQQT